MPKRMIDSKIWQQPWFLDMSMKNKAVWQYIELNCDHAGIWDIDVVELKRKLKTTKVDILKFAAEANRDYNRLTGEVIEVKRVIIFKDSTKLWLTNFVSEQNEKGNSGLSPNVPAVKGILSRLKEEGLLALALKEGYIRIIGQEEHVKGSEGLERVTSVNNNDNYSLFNFKEEDSVKGGEKETSAGNERNTSTVFAKRESKVLQLYQDIWGSAPEDPEQERLTEWMLNEYGQEEVEFAFRAASKYQKKNPAYVQGICKKRKEKRAIEKELEEARMKKLTLQKQELEYQRTGTNLGLLEAVYGEEYNRKTG